MCKSFKSCEALRAFTYHRVPLCLLLSAGTPIRAVLEEQRRKRPDMVVIRSAVLLFASASLMVSTLGFLAPKTSVSVRRSGFLGEVWQGDQGRARGGGSVTSRRELDLSMRLGVGFLAVPNN